MYELPVAIVGGGIAGLGLARALQARSIPFRLVERRRQAVDGGLAINLPGNAIAALAALGLRDRIESLGRPLVRREYRTDKDKILFEVNEDEFWGEARRPRSIRRSDLLDMLGEGLPPEDMHFGTELCGVTARQGHLELELVGGTRLRSRLVVGADGVHSTVRAHAFDQDQRAAHAVLADASWRFMAPNPGIDCWTVWASAEGMILLMPVEGGEVYGWAALTRSPQEAVSNDHLVRLAARFPDRVKQAVLHAAGTSGKLYHSPLEEVRLKNWHRGRTVLIGDAAHATAPVWAEGAALALEDAIVLARSVYACPDVPAAVAGFEKERQRRVAHVQASTDAMSKAARLPPFLRSLLLPFIGPKRYRQTYGPLRNSI